MAYDSYLSWAWNLANYNILCGLHSCYNLVSKFLEKSSLTLGLTYELSKYIKTAGQPNDVFIVSQNSNFFLMNNNVPYLNMLQAAKFECYLRCCFFFSKEVPAEIYYRIKIKNIFWFSDLAQNDQSYEIIYFLHFSYHWRVLNLENLALAKRENLSSNQNVQPVVG